MGNVRRTLILGCLGAALMPRSSVAREVAGVTLPDEVRLQSGTPAMRLTGAGVFRFFFLQVYVCGLYLPPRYTSRSEPLSSDTSRRVSLVMMREVSARLFLWGLDRGLADNTPAAELSALAKPIEELRERIRAIQTLEKGAYVNLDYLPGAGTRILVDGGARGEPIAGKALSDAVLRVWVGDKPLDPALKEALLGG